MCALVLRKLQQPPCALTVVFAGAVKMRAINRQYRGRDYATDVLSFCYDGEHQDGTRFLGEVVLSPEIAALQARRWRTTIERETRKLLIHGVLHLLGYDHEKDRGEMDRLQARLMRGRGLDGFPVVRRSPGR